MSYVQLFEGVSRWFALLACGPGSPELSDPSFFVFFVSQSDSGVASELFTFTSTHTPSLSVQGAEDALKADPSSADPSSWTHALHCRGCALRGGLDDGHAVRIVLAGVEGEARLRKDGREVYRPLEATHNLALGYRPL